MEGSNNHQNHSKDSDDAMRTDSEGASEFETNRDFGKKKARNTSLPSNPAPRDEAACTDIGAAVAGSCDRNDAANATIERESDEHSESLRSGKCKSSDNTSPFPKSDQTFINKSDTEDLGMTIDVDEFATRGSQYQDETMNDDNAMNRSESTQEVDAFARKRRPDSSPNELVGLSAPKLSSSDSLRISRQGIVHPSNCWHSNISGSIISLTGLQGKGDAEVSKEDQGAMESSVKTTRDQGDADEDFSKDAVEKQSKQDVCTGLEFNDNGQESQHCFHGDGATESAPGAYRVANSHTSGDHGEDGEEDGLPPPIGDDLPRPIQGLLRHVATESLPGAFSVNQPGTVNAGGPGEESQSNHVRNADLVVANPVLESSTPQLPTVQPEDWDDEMAESARRKRQKKTKAFCFMWGGAIAVVLTLVAIFLGVTRGRTKEDDTASSFTGTLPKRHKVTKEEYMLSLLPEATLAKIDVSYNGTTMDMAPTPQTQAFQWSINDPKFEDYEDWRLVERFALACLYYSTGGDTHWLETRNWLSYDIDEYNWYSVSSFQTEFVPWAISEDIEGIEEYFNPYDLVIEESPKFGHAWLAHNGLVGTIPPEFFLLTDIRSIDFNANPGLTGTMPSEIGNLHRLELVSFDEDNLWGTLPTQLGRLQNLMAMSCRKNAFSGTLPSELGLLNPLYYNFPHNRLSGQLPSELGLNTNPSVYGFYGNQLSSTLPTELGLLTATIFMDLQRNLFTGPVPSELGNIMKDPVTFSDQLLGLAEDLFPGVSRISFLDTVVKQTLENTWNGLLLGHNLLTGSIPTQLGNFEYIRLLQVGENAMTGAVPSELGLLDGLHELFLFSNQLTSIPTEFGQLENLEFFHCSTNHIQGPILSEIGLMGRLQLLDLHHNQLSGILPSQLGLMSNLEFLFLANNSFTGTISDDLTALAEFGNLAGFTIAATDVHTFPNSFCALGEWTANGTYTGGFLFDCDSEAHSCGCSWCPCNNSTVPGGPL